MTIPFGFVMVTKTTQPHSTADKKTLTAYKLRAETFFETKNQYLIKWCTSTDWLACLSRCLRWLHVELAGWGDMVTLSYFYNELKMKHCFIKEK